MLETPHVAVAASIATKVANPALSLPLAFASHFVLDKIPHWNPHTFTETQKLGRPSDKTTKIAFYDSITALGIGLGASYLALPDINKAAIIIAACFLSVLPDVSKIPYYYFGVRKGISKKWVEIERSLQEDTKTVLPGILTQLTLILTSFFWIFG